MEDGVKNTKDKENDKSISGRERLNRYGFAQKVFDKNPQSQIRLPLFPSALRYALPFPKSTPKFSPFKNPTLPSAAQPTHGGEGVTSAVGRRRPATATATPQSKSCPGRLSFQTGQPQISAIINVVIIVAHSARLLIVYLHDIWALSQTIFGFGFVGDTKCIFLVLVFADIFIFKPISIYNLGISNGFFPMGFGVFFFFFSIQEFCVFAYLFLKTYIRMM